MLNGYPLRLLCSGWPASTSGKWLKKIVIRNKIHDGTKMTGKAYRMPCESIDFGATWRVAELKDPVNRFAWQRWHGEIDFPTKGYYSTIKFFW